LDSWNPESPAFVLRWYLNDTIEIQSPETPGSLLCGVTNGA